MASPAPAPPFRAMQVRLKCSTDTCTTVNGGPGVGWIPTEGLARRRALARLLWSGVAQCGARALRGASMVYLTMRRAPAGGWP